MLLCYGFIRYVAWTRCNSFIVRNKQTKTSNRKFPEDPFRNVKRERKVFPRFSPSPIRFLSYLLLEKGKIRRSGTRGVKRSRLMEKVRKQENKQPGCSRRDAFALKCPKLHVFLLFLPFLARSSVKWTLRDTKRRLQNAFQRRKRFAQAPPSSPIIIAPITRLSISMARIDVRGRINKTFLP